MGYVDGFVLPVKKKDVPAYCAMSRKMGSWMRKQGVVGYYECVGEDIGSKWSTLKFKKMAKCRQGETVFFSFIMYKSKAQRNALKKKMMKDPVMDEMNKPGVPLPFDMKRMAVGGFKVVVDK